MTQNYLYEEGVYAVGFFSPLVAQGQARIRTQLSAGHDQEHLNKALAGLIRVGKKYDILGKTKEQLLEIELLAYNINQKQGRGISPFYLDHIEPHSKTKTPTRIFAT